MRSERWNFTRRFFGTVLVMPTLSVRCPACQQVASFDAALAGRPAPCTHCGQRMLVPAAAPPVVAPPPVALPPVVAPTKPSVAPRPPVEAPAIQVAPAKKLAPVAPAPRRELTAREKASLRVRAQIVLLVLAVLILACATMLILWLTDMGNSS